jgi:hypothetical protein
VAYAVNGALLVGGIVISAIPDKPDCFCIVTNREIGAVPLFIGLGGLLLNLVLASGDKPPPPAKPGPATIPPAQP